MKKGHYFKMQQIDEAKAEIFIYGDIVPEDWRWTDTETSAVSFRDALAELGDVAEIDLRINSGGGNVFEAVAIYNMIKRHSARVTAHIDGLAASAASVIAMAADVVKMPSNSMLMIHNAWAGFSGDHNQIRKFADTLEKINETVKQSYLDKNTSIDAAELSRLMDEETWLSASEALEMGLADEVITAVQVAASITKEQVARYENAPAALTEDPEDNPDDKVDVKQVIQTLQNQVLELQNKIKESKKDPKPDPVKNAGLAGFFLN